MASMIAAVSNPLFLTTRVGCEAAAGAAIFSGS
jgi:hypothetical protein